MMFIYSAPGVTVSLISIYEERYTNGVSYEFKFKFGIPTRGAISINKLNTFLAAQDGLLLSEIFDRITGYIEGRDNYESGNVFVHVIRYNDKSLLNKNMNLRDYNILQGAMSNVTYTITCNMLTGHEHIAELHEHIGICNRLKAFYRLPMKLDIDCPPLSCSECISTKPECPFGVEVRV